MVVGIAIVAIMFLLNQPATSLTLVPPSDLTPTALTDGRAVGAATAPVTLDAWEDFQCPSCGIFTRGMEPRLITDYVNEGKLRIVFHDFAFIGPESGAAATAARAAGNQGAFWPYHDWLFANQNGENKSGFRREVLVAIAQRIGLDVARFEKDLDDPATAAAVVAETNSASSVPVSGTPTLVVNGKLIGENLSWDAIAAAINAVLPGASPSASGTPSASASPVTSP
ncbi:MAG: DsbA family protein [Candidatus Limnocylindrales bacterium]